MGRSEAASELSRARWDKASKAERKQVGAELADARKKISRSKRSAIARAAANARWGK